MLPIIPNGHVTKIRNKEKTTKKQLWNKLDNNQAQFNGQYLLNATTNKSRFYSKIHKRMCRQLRYDKRTIVCKVQNDI